METLRHETITHGDIIHRYYIWSLMETCDTHTKTWYTYKQTHMVHIHTNGDMIHILTYTET